MTNYCNSDKNFSVIYVTSTLIIAGLYFLPQMSILIRFDQLAYLTAVYYICFVTKYVNVNRLINLMKHAIPFCILMFFARGLNFKYGFLHNFMGIWNLIIPSVICLGLFLRNRPRELVFITWSAIIMLLFTCVITIDAMGESMNVMRELTAGTTDEDYAMKLREKGVGGFGIAYAMGALSVGLFALFKQMRRWNIWKFMILALLVFSFYFVTQAQFTTLLIITLIGISVTFFLNAETIAQKLKVIIITIFIISFLPMIVQLIIELYQDSTISTRLSRMYNSLWGDGNISKLSGMRSIYQLDAFKLFLRSPIWGNNITQQPNAFIHLACHSTLLAIACSTGIIGVWSYLKTFYTAFTNEIKLINPFLHRSYFSVVIYYLLFALFNPIDAITEASWIIFVIIPSLFKLYFPKKQFKI